MGVIGALKPSRDYDTTQVCEDVDILLVFITSKLKAYAHLPNGMHSLSI